MERIERERAEGKVINYFLERGANEHGLPEEQLFDTQADPFEFKNLAEDPLQADTKARLKAVLFAWMEQQNDHLSEDGAITLFAVKKHSLNQTEKQFNYIVPEEHSAPVAGLVDPHASTQPNP
jgi:hypothetical protein